MELYHPDCISHEKSAQGGSCCKKHWTIQDPCYRQEPVSMTMRKGFYLHWHYLIYRLRINCSAALDVLHFESGDGTIEEHQQEDFLAFGKLIIELACNIPQSSQNLPRSFELVSHCYSADIKKVVLYLLSKPDSTKNIDHVISLIGSRILHEVNCNQR